MAEVIKAEAMADGQGPRAVAMNLLDIAAEARQVVLDARREAARIVAEARDAAAETLRHATDKGYAEGFARGQGEGGEEGRRRAAETAGRELSAQAAELAALARKIMEGLAEGRAEVLAAAREQMVEFALQIAERVVGHVAALDPEAAKENLAKALEAAANVGGQIVVRVNPGQLPALREHFAALVEAMGSGGQAKLTADAEISPGGVKVLTRGGEVDATVESQLRNVAAALLGREVDRGEEPAERAVSCGQYVPAGEEAESTQTQAASHE
jgi:flagellar biosynthesis/type III secretory pathway protein FliH